MSEEPHKILLDRDLYSVIIREYFADTLSLLEELVNYGSNLIPRCYQSSEKKTQRHCNPLKFPQASSFPVGFDTYSDRERLYYSLLHIATVAF